MAVLMVPPYLQFLDNNGLPLNGGFVGTYSSGTDTPKATYTDNTEGTPADNPVELDAYGRATIWVNGSYRFKVYDADMNLLRTTDGVTSFSVPAASANAYFESFSGTGAQTVYTTSSDLGTDEKAILVWVDAGAGKGYEIQAPSTYTISATTLTFSVAPASGTNNIYVTAPSLLLGAASSSAAAAATSETNAAASATLASQWATLTSGLVAATDYSAKAWAIGGTGVTTTSGKGAAKEWAITTGGAVDTSEFSAKEYATGTTVTTGSAKSWATLTSGLVATVDGSAKAWAIGGTGISATASAGAAKEWATKTSAAVDTAEYSAKAYAIGGTGVTTTSGKGAAKEWATTTGGAVDTSEYSAKEYATGTTATAGSAKSWATLTSGLVMTIDGSAKAWAIGGTGITATSGKGAAKEWATKTSAAVDTTEFSAKEYASGTQAATGGSAKNWAKQTGADVTGASANDRSAKSWAQEDIAGATLGGSAKDWAQSASKPDGTLESAKTYATNAASIAAGVSSTSTTSLLIAVASKTFTTQAGKQYVAGMFVNAASAADPTNYMHGQVTSYSGTTLIVNVLDVGGAGTLADWNIAVSGSRGTTGATGAAGTMSFAAGAGTVDAITANFSPDIALGDGQICVVQSTGANTVTNPTFAPDGLTAHTIVKNGGQALVAGDTGNAGYPLQLEYNLANTRWELMNPSKVVASDIVNPTQLQDGGTVAGTANAITLTPTPALGAYVAKDMRTFKVGATNTSGTVTVAVSGLATRNIKKFIGSSVVLLAVGDLLINSIAEIIDDGTQYILLNPATFSQGADIASSGTTDLGVATGDYVHVTGTTGITAITLPQGQKRTVVFDGALVLTHNATSLILPGGANITTAAGDVAIFRGEASSNVRCIEYNKKNGKGVIAPADADVTFTDITTGNATTAGHGFMPKPANSATTYFDSLGTQTNPALNAVLTGYSSGAGTVASTDTILQAIQKLNGNAPAAVSVATIASGSFPAATTLDITGIAATYRCLLLVWTGASNATTTRKFLVSLNCGGGLGTDTHSYKQIVGTTVSSVAGSASIFDNNTALANTATVTGSLLLPMYQSTGNKAFQGYCFDSAAVHSTAQGVTVATGAIQGIRMWWDLSGNFDAGTYALYGIN